MKKVISSGGFHSSSIVLTLVFALIFFAPVIGQEQGVRSLSKADQHFKKREWSIAILAYKSYLETNPDHIRARINMGKALMKSNRLTEALVQWEYLISLKQEVPAEVYFYTGRTNHQLDQFDKADKNYRLYIEKAGEKADLEMLSYYLKQIGSAHSAGVAGTRYLIENAGSFVNTMLDEFHPVFSPNIDQRFYYSTHDVMAASPIRPASDITSSMKYAEVSDGTWKSKGPLDAELYGEGGIDGSAQDLHLVDFLEDGQKVLFSGPFSGSSRKTFVKSFEESAREKNVSEWIHPVYSSTSGDRDLFTINDSAYLFSSKRLDGYGGYDIFVTFKRFGEWVVQNLGPQINTIYDEISPILSRDGREIYFSSNSDKSIGGYDIFFATFDDNMETWSLARNIPPPLNSGMDDIEIRLSQEGDVALFSSNRAEGHGGFDIYHAYFDEPIRSQSQIHQPDYFYQVNAYRSFASENDDSIEFSEKPVYKLPVLPFGVRPVIISSETKKILNEVLEYAHLFPHIGLLLNVFTDLPPENHFSLYRSVLLLNNVTGYLTSQGMDQERIQIRLYGHQYPRNNVVSEHEEKTERLKPTTGRLEFGFTGTKNLPVQFEVSDQEKEAGIADLSPYEEWKSKTEELYFRIQLAESQNLLKGANFLNTKDYMLAIDANLNHYTYFSGIFQEVDEALLALKSYKSAGYDQAKLVAFIAETKISGEQISTDVIETHPELKKYIIYQN